MAIFLMVLHKIPRGVLLVDFSSTVFSVELCTSRFFVPAAVGLSSSERRTVILLEEKSITISNLS